ncbi:MAG TPA: addiction module protein [Verrucomicrobiae bacterium]|nr:addiction module protein [Verrucomicrobiae bacterium]
MVDEAMIERMTPVEQMKTMELLWRALSRTPTGIDSPAWHGVVVSERLRKIESGEAEFLTVEEVKRRLMDRKQRDAWSFWLRLLTIRRQPKVFTMLKSHMTQK